MVNPFSLLRFLRKLKDGMDRLKDGDLSVEIGSGGSGDLAGLASDFNDIVRKMREMALLKDELAREKNEHKDIESRLTDLVNNLNVGVYRNTIGPHGIFIEVNSAMIRLFEAGSKEDLLKHSVSDLYFDSARRLVFSNKLAEQGYVKDEEIELITLKGRRFWASITAVAHRNEKGETFFDGVIEDISEMKLSRERLKRNYDIQSALASIMSVSFEKVSLQEILEHILNVVMRISWLSLESRAGIFLVEDNPRVLVLKTQKNFPAPVLATCKFVPFGKCICGEAAQSGEIIFSDRIDARHETVYSNISNHGHYCVPLKLTGGKILGVLVLFLKAGYMRDQKEESFLMTLGNIAAAIIERKGMEQKLLQKIEEIDKLNYFMVGREKRIVELKKEVDQTLKNCGKEPHYNIL
ncbi:MAG TPA: GAF domain-containing protein [Candidatus Omnitrophota bacterium]|nr:GAF domain-containing protein [Candidatus Omnitrophota bacterium]